MSDIPNIRSARSLSETSRKLERDMIRTASPMKREFDNFVTDVEDLAHSVSAAGSAEIVSLKSRLTDRVADARDALARVSEPVVRTVRTGAETTDRYVHSDPWKSIGIAAAVGAIIGALLLTSRRD